MIIKRKQSIYIKNIFRFLLTIFLLLIFLPMYISEKIRKLDSSYTISFTVEGSGYQVLIENAPIPDSIIINGEREQVSSSTLYNLPEKKNDIIVSWNTLPSCTKMFKNSYSVVSIDLSKFDSSEITDMSEMFYSCSKLKNINFGNFNTAQVQNMDNMFYDCILLTSLDLSSFKTYNVNSMEGMFYNTESLISLDLKNFDTTKVSNMKNMFLNCNSLIYINLISFNNIEVVNLENIFSEDIDIIYCINTTSAPDIYSILKNYDLESDCENICFKDTRKIIIEEKKCIQECGVNFTELNGICYKNVTIIHEEDSNTIFINPEDEKNDDEHNSKEQITENIELPPETIKIIETIKLITDRIDKIGESDNDILTENIETNKLSSDNTKQNTILVNKSFCENFFKESLQKNNEESKNKDEIIKNIKKEIINGSLDSLISDIINGTKQDLIAEYKDIVYQITTTENQIYNTYDNISTINLGECEDKLKTIYEIDKNLSLIILKIEYKMDGLLIPIIGYEIYHPNNKSQLDLNHCNDTNVKINIPVSIDESSLFKYDPNSDYYNDQCYAYTTENGTDIVLIDRQNEYKDNNLSLCENNCTFNGYDSNTKKALCECEIKININLISDIIEDENILSNNFNSTSDTSTNIGTIKCISLLFSKDGLLTNIGSYILIFTIILFGVSIIIFYKCGYQLIEMNIQEIISLKSNNKNKIDIFNVEKKIKKLKKKKRKKKDNIIGNPNKKNIKKHDFHKTDQLQMSKSELKNTNAIINYEKYNDKQNIIFYKENEKNNKKIKKINCKEFEVNSFNYEEALEFDKRTYLEYYFSLIKTKVSLLFAFFPIDDYNIKIIKICLFFLFFVINFSVNTFFFTESTIHQIYKDNGNYNFGYFLPQIIYSFIISYIINIVIKYFSLSERNLLEIKREANELILNEKKESIKRCLIIKYIIFFVFSFIFLIIFWYYLSSFCAVYKNTQIYIIINAFISFFIDIIFNLIISFLPCTLRIISLKNNKPINECLYKTSKIMQII